MHICDVVVAGTEVRLREVGVGQWLTSMADRLQMAWAHSCFVFSDEERGG
jgi:hypothetical protein